MDRDRKLQWKILLVVLAFALTEIERVFESVLQTSSSPLGTVLLMLDDSSDVRCVSDYF